MSDNTNLRAWQLCAAALALAACADPAPRVRPVTVSGTVSAPDGVQGPVEIRLYHEWSLEGDLRHPLQFIQAFSADLGEFRYSFEYPVDVGEGLVVYAWLDTDGDGVLCTPASRQDIAGLAVAAEPQAEQVEVDVLLTDACRGPDWFYPPAPAG